MKEIAKKKDFSMFTWDEVFLAKNLKEAKCTTPNETNIKPKRILIILNISSLLESSKVSSGKKIIMNPMKTFRKSGSQH